MKKGESERRGPHAVAGRDALAYDGIDLPPPFRAIKLREVGDAFRHAQSIALREGAGTLVYVGRYDVIEFATVLEPDEPLKLARRAFYAGMNALGDALAAIAPPECPIAFVWPGIIHVDGSAVGGARLTWPPGDSEEDPPQWLIFGASIRTSCMDRDAQGLPLAAALDEQGFADLAPRRFIGSFARHLMLGVDAWQSIGFSAVARAYLSRLDSHKGASASIADNGDLHLKWPGAPQPDRSTLLEGLRSPSRLQPAGMDGRS